MRAWGGGLRTISNDSEADKNWKMNKEIERQEEVGHQLPTIQEEGGSELGAAISEISDSDGGQSPTQAHQDTNKETLENGELGGGEIINIEDIDGVFGEERLELREEQVQCVRKKGRGEQQVLTALVLRVEVIFGPMSAETEGEARRGPNCGSRSFKNK